MCQPLGGVFGERGPASERGTREEGEGGTREEDEEEVAMEHGQATHHKVVEVI